MAIKFLTTMEKKHWSVKKYTTAKNHWQKGGQSELVPASVVSVHVVTCLLILTKNQMCFEQVAKCSLLSFFYRVWKGWCDKVRS